MIISDTKSHQPGRFWYARKSYYAGRWYVRTHNIRLSVPAYVSPRFRTFGVSPQAPRTSACGRLAFHSPRP